MPSLPTGTVTFLFTDIEGSTTLLQRLGDRRYAEVLAEHQRLLRDAFAKGTGREIDTQGDAFLVAFSRARDALGTAVAAQQALMKHPWPDGASLRVRMGLHTGEPLSSEAGYVGIDVHRAARIAATGHGGQILVSDGTHGLVAKDLPEGVSLRDLGEHRLRDLAHPHRLFQVVAVGLPTDFPPLKTLDVLPNNLPIQLTSFIGREREKAEVRRLLSTTRFLTLTGPGGAGKTRLALQVAAEALEEFPDGVWLVEFAALTDPSLVPKAVASALGVPEQPGRVLTETLADSLRGKSLLVILDNCEHLVAACAHLTTALLRACPNLRILATSREALGVTGETTWRVPSLSVPDPQHLPLLDRFKEYEAVRLFIDRAVACEPQFAVTSSNAPAVAQVCHRLDGIPLALELAAARVKVLAVEQIAARLDDRFRLLTGGSRTALPRQQTLRAALDWSYDLLPENERMVLCRLSVFAGGWTLEAAEAVCAGDGVEASDILDLLTQLVHKSLVGAETRRGEARYRLLETVRQYGQDRLKDTSGYAAARTQHRDYFLALAERAARHLRAPEQQVWFDRLEADYENLRAALEWSLGSDKAVRLGAALGRFWQIRGYLTEGLDWLEWALAGEALGEPAVRANALIGAAMLAARQWDHRRTTDFSEKALQLSRAVEHSAGVADSLNILGLVAARRGDYARAAALQEEHLAIFRRQGDASQMGMGLYLLSQVAMYQGDYDRASALLTEALALHRKHVDTRGKAMILHGMGLVAGRRGDFERARALHMESQDLFRKLGEKLGVANTNHSLGLLRLREGDLEGAVRCLEESLVLFREIGDRGGQALALNSLGRAAVRNGDGGQAEAFCMESLAIRWEIEDRRGIVESLEVLAGAAVIRGRLGRAARLLSAAAALREAMGTPIPPANEADYARLVAQCKGAQTAAAWAEGRAMTLEQAIEYALAGKGED